MVFRPNAASLPKALSQFHLSQSVELQSASLKGLDWEVAQWQAPLCPSCALAAYIRLIRRTDQLFIVFNSGIQGRPLSWSWLSHWVLKAIQQVNPSTGLPFPLECVPTPPPVWHCQGAIFDVTTWSLFDLYWMYIPRTYAVRNGMEREPLRELATFCVFTFVNLQHSQNTDTWLTKYCFKGACN